jgi:hypothetical protein
MGVERRDVSSKALEVKHRNDLVKGSWADSRADLAKEQEDRPLRSQDAPVAPAGHDGTDDSVERSTEGPAKVERSMSRPEAFLRGAAITGLVVFAPMFEGGPVPRSPEFYGRDVPGLSRDLRADPTSPTPLGREGAGFSRDLRDYAPRLVRSPVEQGEAWLAVKEEQDRDRAIADVGRTSEATETRNA